MYACMYVHTYDVCMHLCVLVLSCYKDDIAVIIQDQGRAKVEFNNNEIIRVRGYNWLLSHIR